MAWRGRGSFASSGRCARPAGQRGLKGCLAGFPPFNRHLRDQVALGRLQLLVFRVAGDTDVGI